MNTTNETKDLDPLAGAAGEPVNADDGPSPVAVTVPPAAKPDRGRMFWLAAIVILALASGVLAYLAYNKATGRYRQPADDGRGGWDKLKAGITDLGPEPAPVPTAMRLIDGIAVPEGEENRPPVAVVIDNHPDARPPAGLARAQLVFEAEAEGGLSRYLALYAASGTIPEIGPVRSARPYFIDWAREFGAVFTHCGGSPEALARLLTGEVNDLNEFYEGGYFWRAGDRSAPHNVMTSSERLGDYLEKENAGAGDYFAWSFKETEQSGSTTGLKIPKFDVEWRYLAASSTYERWLGGKPHADDDGTPILAANVAVMYAPTRVLDEKLRIEITTVGEGKAMLCRAGRCAPARWKKPSLTSRTRFYFDKDEASFTPGTTWIEVVRSDAEVKTVE